MTPLVSEITDFLASCGGVYERLHNSRLARQIVVEVVAEALENGQYILERNAAGEIVHFVCYWKVHPEEVEQVAVGRNPQDVTAGTVLYIAEHGNKTGSLAGIVKELRRRAKGCQGCIWNSKGRGIRRFMRQKGGADDGR